MSTVVLCCNSGFGMINFRSGVIRHLVLLGHRVVVVSPVDSHTPQLSALGAEHVAWPIAAHSSRVVSEVAAVWRLFRIYRHLKPDVAFNFTVKPAIYGSLVSRRLRVPSISVITGLGYAFINRNLISATAIALYRLTLKWSHEVWLLNAEDQNLMMAKGLLRGAAVRIIPGEGIDTSHFEPSGRWGTSGHLHNPHPAETPHQPMLLMIARLMRDKGVYEFVDAARLLRTQGVQARFAILGQRDDNSPSSISDAALSAWEDEGILTYLGSTCDVRPFIQQADCVVLPSYREGIPRTLLEASAMGKPVIASDAPGCRDVVLDGITGLLCRVRDAADLAEKIRQMLLLSSHDRKQMGARGRAFVVETFDERKVIVHYDEVLAAVVENR